MGLSVPLRGPSHDPGNADGPELSMPRPSSRPFSFARVRQLERTYIFPPLSSSPTITVLIVLRVEHVFFRYTRFRFTLLWSSCSLSTLLSSPARSCAIWRIQCFAVNVEARGGDVLSEDPHP